MNKKNFIRFISVAFVMVVTKVLDLDLGYYAGVIVMGDIDTYNRREREDLSGVIDILMLKDDDMKYLSFVNFLPSIVKAFGKKVTAQKHEWLDDASRAEVISVQASGDGADWDTTNDITDLPVATVEVKKLRIGDVLLAAVTDEVFLVSAIDVAAQTIDLYARGHGSTTATVLDHASAHELTIIGNAQIENADPLDADHTSQTEGLNYTQIFEDVAEVTGTIGRSKMANGDELDFQVIKKTKEMLKSLNKSLIEGIKNLDATNKIATMGGLREFITNTSNVNGALTIANLYTAVISHVDAGLFPSAIHGSPTTIGDIEQLYQGAVRTKVSDKRGGTEINVLVILGYEIELHVDKDVRSTEALILDYNRIGYGPLDGGTKGESGSFASYPLWHKRNGKQIGTQVLGEFTMRVSNGGGTRMYGIA
jgi:hypothetical protein